MTASLRHHQALIECLGDSLTVLGVLVGSPDRRSLDAVVLETACCRLADMLFDHAARILDVFEPVYLSIVDLRNVPYGSVSGRIGT